MRLADRRGQPSGRAYLQRLAHGAEVVGVRGHHEPELVRALRGQADGHHALVVRTEPDDEVGVPGRARPALDLDHLERVTRDEDVEPYGLAVPDVRVRRRSPDVGTYDHGDHVAVTSGLGRGGRD